MKSTAADFGEDFTWGVSSSAYQTEGAWLEDGKGYSIWDVFTAQPGRVRLNQHAHNACSFYHRYIQDIILMGYLNIRNFRFSISWPRVLPDGIGRVNEKGLDHYDRMIDFCLEQQIEPWVTLYHWDLPFELEKKGGWTNREVLHWFGAYVDLCVRRYGDRVKHWMVLNEPLVFTGAGYFLGLHAPGRKGIANFLPAVHHAALAQAEGGRIIRSVDSRLQVGTTFSCAPVDPVDESYAAGEAALRTDVLLNRLFLEPLLGKGYPLGQLKVLNQLERHMREGDEQRLAFEMDFIGVQQYTREVVRPSPLIPYLGARIVRADQRGVERTDMNWEVYPEGMYRMLKRFHGYGRIPRLIVTENGAAFHDEVVDDRVHDPRRIDYMERYLAQVLRARKEGVPVDGYFAWSFTDNFEWAEGYNRRFGLVYVDYPSQKRIIKSSGFWLRQFLEPVTAGPRKLAVLT